MLLATVPVAHWDDIKVVSEFCPELNQSDRIVEALGSVIPRVHEESLARYYTYLAARLSLPFTAYYPEPTNTLEEVLHRCVVVELLDPAERLDDGVGGIFCNIHKGPTFTANSARPFFANSGVLRMPVVRG